jgi:hypothetical protein
MGIEMMRKPPSSGAAHGQTHGQTHGRGALRRHQAHPVAGTSDAALQRSGLAETPKLLVRSLGLL